MVTAATAATTAASSLGGCRCRTRRATRTDRGEHTEQSHGVVMTLRTRRRIVRLRHRATLFEHRIAGLATELVRGHAPSVGTVSSPAPLSTRPAVAEPITEQIPETGEPTMAHIVKTEPGEDAAAKVLEARIYGTPLEALCGHVWVPSRDPKQLPLCDVCKDIYETYRMFNDGLNETPQD